MTKNKKNELSTQHPLLMSAVEMAKVSGIGENTLRNLMSKNEIEYLQIGSHRLLAERAIWDYYDRNKITVAVSTDVTCNMQGKIYLMSRSA